jgi:hypothetical protein
MSPNLSQSFGRARGFAHEQSHRALLLEHLLLALTEDPEASGVLRACNVDTDRLSTDISGYLGRLTEDMRAAPGTEPSADAELLRVIEAARQAAQQSRRKAIDGAIVLAAIVGDAKSPAAGLLKAHGMTFDEAIKTLQKASAQARTKQYSTSTGHTQPEPAAGGVAKEAAREPAPAPSPASWSTPSLAPSTHERPTAASQSAATTQMATGAGQTVDDILAAARARIQRRSAPVPPKAKPELEPNPEPAPKPEPERPPPAMPPFSAPSTPASPERPHPPPLSARLSPGGLGLPPTPPGASPAPPLPPNPRPVAASPSLEPSLGPSLGPSLAPSAEPSLPPRLLQKPAGDSGTRPPMPRRRPDGTTRADARGDWADVAEPTSGARAAQTGGPRRPALEAGRPPMRPAAPPARAAGQRPAAGPLMEAIPRRVRVGTAAGAQVRIGRDKVESLMQLLAAGRAAVPPADVVLARVLSVRLLAPDGGFAIEAETPETQWIEASPSQAPNQPHEDHVGWRWTLMPLARGRRRLQLVVVARTVGRDGIGPEASPPDRIIEIAVRPNRLRQIVRWTALMVLLAGAVGLGRMSQDKLAQDLVDVLAAIWGSIQGLLVTSGFLAG